MPEKKKLKMVQRNTILSSPSALIVLIFSLLNISHLIAQVYFNLGLAKAIGNFLTMGLWGAAILLALWSMPRISPMLGIVLLYVVAQTVQGLLNSEHQIYAVTTGTIYFGVFAIANYIANLEYPKYIRLFGNVLVLSGVALLAVNAANWLVRGHGMATAFQKEMPSLLSAAVFAVVLFGNDRQLKWLRALTIFVFLYYPLELILGYFGGTLQEIGVAIYLGNLLFIALVYAGRNILWRRRNAPYVASALVKLSLLLAMIIAPSLLGLALTLSGGSLIDRLSVASVMVTNVSEDWWTSLFGFGFGSSDRRFDIGAAYSAIGEQFEVGQLAPDSDILAHSGIVSLIYENGVAGMVVLGYAIFKISKAGSARFMLMERPNNEQFAAFARLCGMFFLFMWFATNTLTFSGTPMSDPYYQGNIIGNLFAMVLAIRGLFAQRGIGGRGEYQ